MKYTSLLITALVFYTLGSLFPPSSFFSPEKVVISNNKTPAVRTEDNPKSAPALPESVRDLISDTDTNTLTSLPESVLRTAIDNTPPEDLSNIIEFLIPGADTESIDNPVQFAKRIADELNLHDGEVSPDSESHVYVSESSDSDETATKQQRFRISPKTRLYAHIDTRGALGSGANKIFARWVNLDRGEVIHFEPKPIRSGQDTNWIGLIPEDGWQTGLYEVTFYRFSSSLEKLASETFYVEIP